MKRKIHFDLSLPFKCTLNFLEIVFAAGKSSVLMDVKPWDDETDMKKLEEAVRSVQMDGLFWGACMFLTPFNEICLFMPAKLSYLKCRLLNVF